MSIFGGPSVPAISPAEDFDNVRFFDGVEEVPLTGEADLTVEAVQYLIPDPVDLPTMADTVSLLFKDA